MHLFDPDLSIKDNCLKAADIEFAAWLLAGHEHREEYRKSGQLSQRSAWLHAERMRALKDSLANGELVALGIAKDDPSLEISRIPENLFLSGDLRFNGESSSISGMGWEFANVRICRIIPGKQLQSTNPKNTGRPNHLPLIMDAWAALKGEMAGFLQLDKSVQNREIQKKVAILFPAKFPGNNKVGESTIRRHRREYPELFV